MNSYLEDELWKKDEMADLNWKSKESKQLSDYLNKIKKRQKITMLVIPTQSKKQDEDK